MRYHDLDDDEAIDDLARHRYCVMHFIAYALFEENGNRITL